MYRGNPRLNWRVTAGFCLALLLSGDAAAQNEVDLESCRSLLRTGKYEECVKAARAEISRNAASEQWWLLAIEGCLAQGEYRDALELLHDGVLQHRRSVRLRYLGHEVCLRNDDPRGARQMLEDALILLSRSRFLYSDAEHLVVIGQIGLLMEADPKMILEQFFDRARNDDPKCRSVYLATGELALEKADDQVAADAFEAGLKHFPDDADLRFGLARAYKSSNPGRSQQELDAALTRNPRHVEAMLFSADFLIDAERYAQAEQVLAEALTINPRHPTAWTYRAVLANLRNDWRHERAFRAAGLQSWSEDPRVDHLLGKKLSQKYRFEEGAAFQRQALRFDPGFLPAKIQLSQDLLRLGRDEEGWKLADEAQDQDAYDVVTFNLMQLRDKLVSFRTFEEDGIRLRMDPKEAAIYGRQTMRLLQRAKDELGEKYDFELDEPVTVEIFPQQSDFAVRTFGIPGGSGYLGVCFGRVITANSPASQRANPANWQSVLWHEYCHVVTLQLTQNKMPRWLSEGLSVYEERQADPAWGQRMTPAYRKMILEGELTPVGRLSGAFLNPPSGRHLQFAYYQSSLVVEYFIERFGFASILAVLRDLGAGMPVNSALERHSGLAIGMLEQEFEDFAKQKADALAPGLSWESEGLPDAAEATPEDFESWLNEHPDSYPGLVGLSRLLIRQERWEEAEEPLQRLLDEFPDQPGRNSPYRLLATVYRNLGETEQERAVLERLARIDDAAVEVYSQLLDLDFEVDEKDRNWPRIRENAERLMAVDPLRRDVHWRLGLACEALGDEATAIESFESLIAMEPADPAEAHFRLARLLRTVDPAQAKRQALLALEAAPRYRLAQKLLLALQSENAQLKQEASR